MRSTRQVAKGDLVRNARGGGGVNKADEDL